MAVRRISLSSQSGAATSVVALVRASRMILYSFMRLMKRVQSPGFRDVVRSAIDHVPGVWILVPGPKAEFHKERGGGGGGGGGGGEGEGGVGDLSRGMDHLRMVVAWWSSERHQVSSVEHVSMRSVEAGWK
ncbi:uncharacterized protein SPSK_06718 [Sporothrix schenckii 1099-18]|uniref:Uncharacterized protein n=1 Tax=Sporothrix schenckii 1099-18 TaxID=1397361 RepID=A0A0F2MIS9_SPOSC|nr:uncharacterized protein SPSK_06718 [Sporothrix schenckii 1099-18]KJR89522.1 hypothetical protein SPSK_06718 [Sporothrix schenckii 1099-18]